MRVKSIDDLPPGLAEQARAQLAGLAKPQVPRPLGTVALDAPRQAAENARASALVQALNDAVRGGTGVVRVDPAAMTKPKRANKYGAVATVVDGIRFDSKREAAYYTQLKLRVQLGEVRYFLRQVPIHLPGGTRLVVDFLEVHADGSLHYVDAKGRQTKEFKIKRREIQHHYPITVELV